MHQQEVQQGHRNRATLEVARKLLAYLLAVDKSEKHSKFARLQRQKGRSSPRVKIPKPRRLGRPPFPCTLDYGGVEAVVKGSLRRA